MPQLNSKQRTPRRILLFFAVLSVLGLVGLVLTVVVGFEEPDSRLLLMSSFLAFASPVAIAVHLTMTKELTREKKRIWVRELTGARAGEAFSAYIMCDDRSVMAETLSLQRGQGTS